MLAAASHTRRGKPEGDDRSNDTMVLLEQQNPTGQLALTQRTLGSRPRTSPSASQLEPAGEPGTAIFSAVGWGAHLPLLAHLQIFFFFFFFRFSLLRGKRVAHQVRRWQFCTRGTDAIGWPGKHYQSRPQGCKMLFCCWWGTFFSFFFVFVCGMSVFVHMQVSHPRAR